MDMITNTNSLYIEPKVKTFQIKKSLLKDFIIDTYLFMEKKFHVH